MAKFKHNKKRNTAIIYNILINEFIDGHNEGDENRGNMALRLIKEYFAPNKSLSRELRLYNELLGAYSNTKFNDSGLVEKLIESVKVARKNIDKINEQKTQLINVINRSFGIDVWNKHSIENYKNLATVSQIFDSSIGQSDRILLEKKYTDDVVSNRNVDRVVVLEDVPLVYKLARKEFKVYKDNLIEENYVLLGKYIDSWKDKGMSYKLYLNEEIKKIKNSFNVYLDDKNIDKDIKVIIKESLDKIESLKESFDDEGILRTVIIAQNLVKEIKND